MKGLEKPFTNVCPPSGRKGFVGQRMMSVYDAKGKIVCTTSLKAWRSTSESIDIAEHIAKALNAYT